MSRYIAVIDQCTTSTHCMLFDRRGEVAATHRLEYQQILPQPGWVEHDPNRTVASNAAGCGGCATVCADRAGVE